MLSQGLRYGVLGTGYVADWWVESVSGSQEVSVVAVASRAPQRAQAFALRHRLPRAHTSYQALLADPQIDAVYIALPNNWHANWVHAALVADKHVLCEKPLALDGDTAAALYATAASRRRLLLEGFPYRYTRHCARVVDLLREGAIGRPRMLRANWSYVRAASVRRDAQGRPIDPLVAGGALEDSGCYAVNLAGLIFGGPPDSVQAMALCGSHQRDEIFGAILTFGDALAVLSASFVLPAAPQVQVLGEQGVLETTFDNVRDSCQPATIRLTRGTSWDAPTDVIVTGGEDGFRGEAEALARLVAGERLELPIVSPPQSIDGAATLAALAASASERRRIDLRSSPARDPAKAVFR